MDINSNTKIADILSQYPWLLDELAKINDRFKIAKTPIGKIMLKKATIADMSKRSGVDENTLISKLNELIKAHERK
jgi:hypothetical protein